MCSICAPKCFPNKDSGVRWIFEIRSHCAPIKNNMFAIFALQYALPFIIPLYLRFCVLWFALLLRSILYTCFLLALFNALPLKITFVRFLYAPFHKLTFICALFALLNALPLKNLDFLGGISLQGNPWLCTCQNTWLGTWLRRWMRETLQLHASIIDRNHHIQTMVRTITCQADQKISDLQTGSATARIAASSGNGGLLPTEESEFKLIERPLVDLSEGWTCSDLTQTSSAVNSAKIQSWILLCFLVVLRLW